MAVSEGMDFVSELRVRKEAKGHKKVRQNKENREDGEDERGNGYSFGEGQIQCHFEIFSIAAVRLNYKWCSLC
jgi:hypothetical protein